MVVKPVIQVVGFKNSGKTTVVCELIKRFSELGFKVGSIKHDAHDFEIDYPGKDTWKHREAGASAVAISSKEMTAFIEKRGTSLEDLIGRMNHMDLILVEGYKYSDFPKVVLIRDEKDIDLIRQTTSIQAICTWFTYSHSDLPVISIQDMDSLFQLLLQFVENWDKGED